jgi:GNAT superfamily N-acetyltransferase
VPADPDIVKCWVTGWALSRRLAAPIVLPEGYYVQVGLPRQQARYVLPRLELHSLLALAETIDTPWTFIKVCADPKAVAAALPKPWTLQEDPRLMMTAALAHTADLADADAVARDCSPYLSVEGEVIGAEWRDRAGTVVASGRAAMVDSSCIFDQISVHADHRRRGLGRAVVGLLRREALKRDKGRGILVATTDGIALYSTIGWEAHSAYASAMIS